jgi:hypothetical protein
VSAAFPILSPPVEPTGSRSSFESSAGQPHVDDVTGDITNFPGLRRRVWRIAVAQRSLGGHDINRRKTMGPNLGTISNGAVRCLVR